MHAARRGGDLHTARMLAESTVAALPDLVGTDWLSAALADGGVKILDARWSMPGSPRSGRQAYDEAHIPGAIHFDIDAVPVLRKSHDLGAAINRHRQFGNPFCKDAFDVVLPQGESIVVSGREVADIESGAAKGRDLCDAALRKKAIDNSASIEKLDGAGMQPPGARACNVLTGTAFDNGDVDARQCQFACQHHPRRSASGDHDRMTVMRHGVLASTHGHGRLSDLLHGVPSDVSGRAS